MRRHLPLAVTLLLLASSAWAARQYVQVTPPAAVSGKPGDKVEVSIPFKVLEGFHINSNKPTFKYMIATQMEWAGSELKHLDDAFPPAQMRAFSFSKERLAVYEGTQTVKARFTIPASASGKLTADGKLRYQACDQQTCYPPNSIDVKVTVEVKK